MRSLGPVDATMIVMGSMIGSGIFITSAESSRLSGAPGWLLLAWAIAGLLTITGALCCSELATMMPRAGGVYIFLREAYGKSVGFLYGWTLFLVIQTGTIAAVAIAFAKFLGVFVAAVSPDNYLVAPISFGHYAISLSTEQLVAIGLIASGVGLRDALLVPAALALLVAATASVMKRRRPVNDPPRALRSGSPRLSLCIFTPRFQELGRL